MIITLITIGLLLVTIISDVIAYNIDCRFDLDIFCLVGDLLIALFSAVLLVEIIIISSVHGLEQKEFSKRQYEKEVLEYRLKEGELQGNELLYHDIVEFNNELRARKYYYNNPWTSWFESGKVASIEYIEIGKDK